jgi:hypothetical protein
MSMTLVEALQQVPLEGGRTYRCRVHNWWVELHVRDAPPDESSSLVGEDDIRLDDWIELPKKPPAGIWPSRLIEPPLPDIPEIPTEDDGQ